MYDVYFNTFALLINIRKELKFKNLLTQFMQYKSQTWLIGY